MKFVSPLPALTRSFHISHTITTWTAVYTHAENEYAAAIYLCIHLDSLINMHCHRVHLPFAMQARNGGMLFMEKILS